MQRDEIVLISFLTEILGKQVVILQNEANKLWDKIPLCVHNIFYVCIRTYMDIMSIKGRVEFNI